MSANDKEYKLEKLDEAYNKLEGCFYPLSEASVALQAAGYKELGESVMSSVSNVQRVQDVVRENCRQMREGD